MRSRYPKLPVFLFIESDTNMIARLPLQPCSPENPALPLPATLSEAKLKEDANQLIAACLPQIQRDLRHIKRLGDEFSVMKWVCNHDGPHSLRLDYLAVMDLLRASNYDEDAALELIAYLRSKNILQEILNPQNPAATGTEWGSFTFTLDFYRYLEQRLVSLLPPTL